MFANSISQIHNFKQIMSLGLKSSYVHIFCKHCWIFGPGVTQRCFHSPLCWQWSKSKIYDLNISMIDRHTILLLPYIYLYPLYNGYGTRCYLISPTNNFHDLYHKYMQPYYPMMNSIGMGQKTQQAWHPVSIICSIYLQW